MKTQELTWQDVQRIVDIADDLRAYADNGIIEEYLSSEEEFFGEILKRFKEAKSCGSH